MIGVLLINTGTPDEPTEEAIARYLEQMLSDPMLISTPPFIWKRVLKHCILPHRPKKTIGFYKRMWRGGSSIFMDTSLQQRDLIEQELNRTAADAETYTVELAMRYGNPTIQRALEHLREKRCEKLVIVPLYPQYTRVCAGTCFKEVDRQLENLITGDWNPDVSKVDYFYDQPGFIEALEQSVRERWKPQQNSMLVISFHSTLVADIKSGDPYHKQNTEIAERLARALDLEDYSWVIGYQSRFDSRRWLQPPTESLLKAMAAMGKKDVCVLCPGFVAENIESGVETGETLRDVFLDAAGDDARYTYIPTLDTAPGLIQAITSAIRQKTS